MRYTATGAHEAPKKVSRLFEDTIPDQRQLTYFPPFLFFPGVLRQGTLAFIVHPFTDESAVQATSSFFRCYILLHTVDREQAAVAFFQSFYSVPLKHGEKKQRKRLPAECADREAFPGMVTAAWCIPF